MNGKNNTSIKFKPETNLDMTYTHIKLCNNKKYEDKKKRNVFYKHINISSQ